MIAMIAALPREIAGLVRGTRADEARVKRDIALYWIDSKAAVVVAAGMGAARATLAVQAAFDDSQTLWSETPTMLLSIGLAGSCTPGLAAGEVVTAGMVIDANTGERFDTADSASPHVLVTGDTIASVQEKARLAAAYGASLVDMEAATVARLARARGVPFRAVKAVSDEHDVEMDSLARFAGANGQFRTAAFALHTAARPMQWGAAMRLGRNSKLALGNLTRQLRAMIETQ